jgi:hypothetical protein
MCILARSSVQSVFQAIDCRRLTLHIGYYFLNQDAVSALASDFIHWLQANVADSCIFRWHHNGKVCGHKHVLTTDRWAIPEVVGLRLGFDAYVKNSAISNASAIVKYQKSISLVYAQYRRNVNVARFASESSVDYPAFFDAKLPVIRQEDSTIVDNIAEIFSEKGRKLMSFHRESDLNGHVTAYPYQEHPGLYYGSVSISFSAFCLDTSLDQIAHALVRFACSLSEMYGKLNAHVCLQPKTFSGYDKASPYMRYFGKHLQGDGSCESAQCHPEEWYPTYYLCGVEWMNILSPLTKQHLAEHRVQSGGAGVSVQALRSGGLQVMSTKPITAYEIEDALTLKQIVLPALYPGKGSVPLRGIYPGEGCFRVYDWCPRNDWAIVPIEKTEVEIVGPNIVFFSRNSTE